MKMILEQRMKYDFAYIEDMLVDATYLDMVEIDYHDKELILPNGVSLKGDTLKIAIDIKFELLLEKNIADSLGVFNEGQMEQLKQLISDVKESEEYKKELGVTHYIDDNGIVR